jgi:hypothetical protein
MIPTPIDELAYDYTTICWDADTDQIIYTSVLVVCFYLYWHFYDHGCERLVRISVFHCHRLRTASVIYTGGVYLHVVKKFAN